MRFIMCMAGMCITVLAFMIATPNADFKTDIIISVLPALFWCGVYLELDERKCK